MGFYWWHDRHRTVESHRARGPRGDVEYVPVEEKEGFWRNYGMEVLGSVCIFVVSTFILVYGFGHGLLLGGTLYVAVVLGAVILSAVWPFFAYARWRRMHRIAERLTSPTVPPAEGRATWARATRRRWTFRILLAVVAAALVVALGAAVVLLALAPVRAHTWSGPAPGPFVEIRPGTFEMGSTHRQPGYRPAERRHTVTLTRGFRIQAMEVREDHFTEVLGYNPLLLPGPLACRSNLGRCSPDCPARFITWNDAVAYCNALSRGEGLPACYRCVFGDRPEPVRCELDSAYSSPYECLGYRLPTEAEWEYAARAGTTEATYNGPLTYEELSSSGLVQVLDPIAWYEGNSGLSTHAVGTKRPNAWGLHDMLGNVAEWVHDWYSDYPRQAVTDPWGPPRGEVRVFRGGYASSRPRELRASARSSLRPEARAPYLSFRVARTLER